MRYIDHPRALVRAHALLQQAGSPKQEMGYILDSCCHQQQGSHSLDAVATLDVIKGGYDSSKPGTRPLKGPEDLDPAPDYALPKLPASGSKISKGPLRGLQ